jgi:hypothetical protein
MSKHNRNRRRQIPRDHAERTDVIIHWAPEAGETKDRHFPLCQRALQVAREDNKPALLSEFANGAFKVLTIDLQKCGLAGKESTLHKPQS